MLTMIVKLCSPGGLEGWSLVPVTDREGVEVVRGQGVRHSGPDDTVFQKKKKYFFSKLSDRFVNFALGMQFKTCVRLFKTSN